MHLPIERFAPWLALFVMGLAAAGCGDPPRYPLCKKDKHCKAEDGEKCVEGVCQSCASDADCANKGANTKCHELRCVDPATIGPVVPGELGSDCSVQSDCTGGWACVEGKCSMCTEDPQCSPSTCNVETGRCSSTGQCQNDDECPMDQICDGGTCIYTDPGGTQPSPCGLSAVYFGFDDDTIGDKQAPAIEALAKCIAEQGKPVVLEAHADNVGTEEYNILLTERRGASVKDLLIDKGAPADLLQVIAKGDLEASGGTTERERSEDRRVQFVWP